MKPQDHQDAQDIIDHLKSGTANRRDLVALLIYVREQLPNDMLRDIAHCVAHTERDRGYAYTYIDNFVAHFIDVAERGGTLVVKPLFPIEDLVSQMHSDFSAINFNVTLAELDAQRHALEGLLGEVLSDTSIKLRDSRVVSCQFQKLIDDGREILAFVVQTQKLQPGALTIPNNARVAFPVFS